MKFSKVKEEQLQKKVIDIMLKCFLEMMETGKIEYAEDWYVMEKCFYAGLVETTKEYFLLGQLIERMYDEFPQILEMTMSATGILKDESKASKCFQYWKDKYGEAEAKILSNKLVDAFFGDKYSTENIKSMGDKMEIIRGNNKI